MANDRVSARRAGRVMLGSLLALAVAAPAGAARKAITPQSIQEDLIAARCKAEARKYYSVVQLRKRRAYEKSCIERAYR